MKKPSTIFHLDGERGLRGGQRQLLYLAAAQKARGRRAVVWARAGSELERAAEAAGLVARRLPYLFEWDPASAAVLAAAARREGAILHSHTAHAAGVAALAGLSGAPVVMHRRVDFPVSRASAALKYARAGRVAAVSRAIAALLVEAGLPADKVAVVPDAVPVDETEASWLGGGHAFRPPTPAERDLSRRALAAELGLDPSAEWIGNLAALVPHKDHDTLLAAAVIVLMRRPRARFLIAGRGPEETRLFESIKRMGLLGRVLLLGQREPLPLLRALDLYCQSSWGEGMGSVLIEAAALGLPVAATAAGGIPEVVAHGETGLLVPPRDPEALAAAIVELLDAPDRRRAFGAAARERARGFGLAAMAARMEEVYDAVA
jgi:glycosyltransferase involved in cell wall biosynthesis